LPHRHNLLTDRVQLFMKTIKTTAATASAFGTHPPTGAQIHLIFF